MSVRFRSGLVLSGLLALLTVGILLYLQRHAARVEMRVQFSRGDAIRSGGGVLLPGMTVPAGETVRTHGSKLRLRDAAGDLQIQLEPAARLRLDGSLERSDGLHVTHLPHGGEGASHTRDRRLVHRWNRARLVQRHGRLRWRHPAEGLRLRPGRDFRGHWEVPGGTFPVEPKTPFVTDEHAGTGPLFPLRRPPLAARRNTSLIPLDPLMDRLERHARERGVPRSLQEVFGHWVRDRWGNVYLYRPADRALRVTSAGPDGRFYSPDDVRRRRFVTRRIIR